MIIVAEKRKVLLFLSCNNKIKMKKSSIVLNPYQNILYNIIIYIYHLLIDTST